MTAIPPRPPRLLHAFANFVPGGSELRAVRLINAFGDRFSHDVLSMDGRTTAMDFVEPTRRAGIRLLDPPPPAGTAQAVGWLRRLLRENDPDLLLTYGWGAFDMVMAAASLGLRRIIHHEDGFNADEARKFKRRRIWARRLLLPTTGGVIVPSRRLEAIARRLWWQPEQRLCLIPNGIAADRYAPTDGNGPLRTRLGIPATARVIGTVANLRPEKNLARLVAACSALDDVHLVIVGDGPERPQLQALTRLGRRLHLVGHHTDPRPYLRCFDIFALSSDTEQMPLSVLEAMACALPVVATDVGDLRTMLPPEQHPFLVALGSITDDRLADRLRWLSDAPILARRLGEANRRHVAEHYDFSTMVGRYRDIYESISRP